MGSFATLSINDTEHNETKHNDTQLSSFECHYAESRFFIVMLSVVIFGVDMLSVVAPLQGGQPYLSFPFSETSLI